MNKQEIARAWAQKRYFNRDISWLSFNERVLMEAEDPEVPLYDRIKFLAIYSSNLDEFFRVRVAYLQNLKALGNHKLTKQLPFDPLPVLDAIHQAVTRQQERFGQVFRQHIIPALAKEGIFLLQDMPTEAAQIAFMRRHLKSRVLAYLQPVLLSANRKVPNMLNQALYFIVPLRHPDMPEGSFQLGMVNIPSQTLPRFLSLPQTDGQHRLMFLDDVIRYDLDAVFPGYEVLGCYSIKMNRDAELSIDDEFSGDLVGKIHKQVEKRSDGPPTRFLYDATMPREVLDKVQEILRIDDEDLVPGGRYHNFMDFFQFPNPVGKHLEQAAPVPLPHLGLETQASFFEVIARQDVLLHFPYQSYDYVLQFFNTAAIDPLVKAIKVTVYRIAGNSFIANALISAARNGKKVTVFVEVKARFDEINNLKWAQEMKKAGVKIIYSIPGLKVHAKVALVTRREPQGNRHYAYMGTGNFNESTARFYADHGLLTANPALTHEIGAIFSYLKDQRKQPVFQHLLVAPMNLQPGLLGLIDREIANARNGLPAGLVLKLNSLEDEVMIEKLYEASEAGVPIHLIVRGICCLVPGIPGQSERIQVTRIVDFFLEHARIFVFHNQGDPQIFMGSADWMKRNLYHRVEVVFPVLSPALKNEVWACLALQLTDSQKAVWLDANLQNIRKQHGEMEESLAGWFPTETNSTDAIQTYPRGANPRGANPRRANPRRAQFDFYHWLEAQSTQHE